MLILIPSDIEDLNLELRRMAINENMGRLSMLAGICYTLVFPENF